MIPSTERTKRRDEAGSRPSTTLVLERRLPAAPHRVYAAWTSAEWLSRWLAPGDMTVERAEADARVGGRWAVVMRAPDGAIHSPSGVYEEVVPGERLVFTWHWSGAEEVTRVSVELRAAGAEATDLRLTHEGFRDEADRDAHAEGWRGCLAKLPERLVDDSDSPESPGAVR